MVFSESFTLGGLSFFFVRNEHYNVSILCGFLVCTHKGFKSRLNTVDNLFIIFILDFF